MREVVSCLHLSVARLLPLPFELSAMLYAAEAYQAILDEHRNGVSLAKGIVAGLGAAFAALEMEPEQVMTCLQDQSMVDTLLEAEDEDGEALYTAVILRNVKLHKKMIAMWAADKKEGNSRAHAYDDKDKGKGKDEEEEEEDKLLPTEVSSDSDEEPAMKTRSGVQTLKGAAKSQGLTLAQVLALGNGLYYGKVQPDDLKKKKISDRKDPRLSEVAKSLRKMKAKTWEAVYDKGGLPEIREFFRVLASSAKNLREPLISVKVHEWYNTTAEVILGESSSEKEVAELKEYINKYLERYYGLGLPVELDYELLARGQARRNRGAGSSDEDVKGLKAELIAALGEVKRLAAGQNDMRESLRVLKEKVGKNKGPGDGKDKKCFICGGDHLAKECPHKKDKTNQDKTDKDEE